MAYTYTVAADNTCELFKDGVKIDTVGPWDSAEGAHTWGSAVCDKYNSNPTFVYPGEEPAAE